MLLVIILIFSILAPTTFAQWSNFRLIIQNASILAVLAVGMTFVISTAGIDLSIGSVLVFSGVVAAITMRAIGGEGWGVAAVGIVVAVISGSVLGSVQRVPDRQGQDPAADRHPGNPRASRSGWRRSSPAVSTSVTFPPS